MILRGYKVQKPYKYLNSENKETEDILDFKRLNIFVGSNNAGKSRFMRDVFSSGFSDKITDNDYDLYFELKSIYEDLKTKYPEVYSLIDLKKLLSEKYFNDLSNRYFPFFDGIRQKASVTGGWSTSNGIRDIDMAQYILDSIDSIESCNQFSKNNFKSVYIPMIRGLRNFQGQKDIYFSKTAEDYFRDKVNENIILDLKSENKEVFSGLGIYEKVKNMLLGDKKSRVAISEYQEFLKKEFFENKKEFTLIPNPNKDILSVDIGDHKDRKIYDVGDGIQSMIINTFPAFENKEEKTILFIEEPEMTMHPSMQRTLIDTLLSKEFSNLQVFVTTHSNHFLDLVYDYPDDVSIYSFQEDLEKTDEQGFVIKSITQNSQILDILGIRNSSVFLANSVIWVEGVTDRMFLRKLFEIFRISEEYKEDYDYAISEFGGGNIDNFDFSLDEDLSEMHMVNVYQGLSKNNFIILDNDGKNENGDLKKIKRDKLAHLIGVDNIFSEHMEIENLISFKVWAKVLPDLIKNSNTIKMKKSYSDNEEKFNQNIGTKDIGYIMRDVFIELKEGKTSGFFNEKDITCLGHGKKVVMDKVIEAIKDEDDFTNVAKSLIEKFRRFIIKNKMSVNL